MKLAPRIVLVGCFLLLGAGAAFAGINSKEVGALLIYPEYRVSANPLIQTYVTVTNNKSSAVNAHVEVIGQELCSDCNFDLPLTGFQTRRLRLRPNPFPPFGVLVEDASVSSDPNAPAPRVITACPETAGFVVVTLEAAGDALGNPAEPRVTLGENMLHGDEVVVDVSDGDAVQVGAIAVQGVGPNDGDRVFRFDNLEYAAFPSIVTADFWAENFVVFPVLILFNVDFMTGTVPSTSCSLNFVDAEEHKFSRNLNFGCWTFSALTFAAPGSVEPILGTANGYLWAQCDAGTHGAIWTFLESTFRCSVTGTPCETDADCPPDTCDLMTFTCSVTGTPCMDDADCVGETCEVSGKFPHRGGQFKDTLFQSVTTNPSAVLRLTPDVTGTP